MDYKPRNKKIVIHNKKKIIIFISFIFVDYLKFHSLIKP
jgi:hypothetical protein